MASTLINRMFNPAEAAKRHRARVKKKAEAALFRELKREAKYYERVIIEAAAQQGMVHYVAKSRAPSSFLEAMLTGRRSVQKLRIPEVRFNKESIWFRIDTEHLPYMVSIAMFRDPDYLETLSHAARRPIRFDSNPESGAWLILERDGSTYRIPTNFAYGIAMNKMAELDPQPGPLAFVVGAAPDGLILTADLAKAPHLLIAGETGSGKSVSVNSVLITYAWRNDPADLKFIMLDLKDGQELGDYDKLPHMLLPVARSPEAAIEALITYKAIMDERGQRMGAAGCRDIYEWNRLHSNDKLPFVVLVIDELAQLLKHPQKEVRTKAEEIIGLVLATSRARGGHALLSTQTPRTDVVSGYLKTNVPMRICFSVPGRHDSITVIGSGMAAGLEPAGRGVFKYGNTVSVFQAPNITSHKIRGAIAEIARRKGVVKKRPELTAEIILEWALTVRNGSLAFVPIFENFKPFGWTRVQIEQFLGSIEGREFEIKGQRYKVINYGRPTGRRVEPVVSTEDQQMAAD